VVDLTLTPGKVSARVSGSALYTVTIEVAPLAKARWKALCAESAGAIDSVVELLQGRFAKGVMERLCQPRIGLFPAPSEMSFSCSCPDWASMCKHVAASLYGVGARLDRSPELFFTLRQVDEKELIAHAGEALAKPGKAPAADRVLSTDGLEELFGLDLGSLPLGPGKPARKPPEKKGGTGGKKALAPSRQRPRTTAVRTGAVLPRRLLAPRVSPRGKVGVLPSKGRPPMKRH
jgi:hypothetical protein